MLFHGSDIEKIAKIYKLNKDQIIDLASNVNPLGLSSQVENILKNNLTIISKYPDPSYLDLKNAISKFTGNKKENILLSLGSSDLIIQSLTCFQAKNAVIIGPTYSEYKKVLRQVGGQERYYYLNKENNFAFSPEDFLNFLPSNTDMIIICNPNNPTASAILKDHIEKIATSHKDINILVDETYIEFVEGYKNYSVASLVDAYPNIIALRSFSKFFAAPGLRLGYGLTSNEQLKDFFTLKSQNWPINSLVALAGQAILEDKSFMVTTNDFVKKEKEFIINSFSNLPAFKLYPSKTNYFLVEMLDQNLTSDDVFKDLILNNIMVRNLSDFPSLKTSFIRFCLGRSIQNQAFIEAIKKLG